MELFDELGRGEVRVVRAVDVPLDLGILQPVEESDRAVREVERVFRPLHLDLQVSDARHPRIREDVESKSVGILLNEWNGQVDRLRDVADPGRSLADLPGPSGRQHGVDS